eukprot:TRINITY_DN75983_c0_g1_i1.p1 TRINITY_DN75983_c0_g1~~TRINITY_DN75983_c0_g1_i1.p1  ORF type:complete len:194 (+),score=43.99 TRINITY_DN75983_c0_g1_i1:137-718(+)
MAASDPAVYYRLLGVEPGTMCEEILRRAYKKAALRWHPDKNPDLTAKAEAMFKKVSEAYSVLLFLSRKNPEESPKKPRTSPSSTDRLSSVLHSFGMDDAFQLFEDVFKCKDPFKIAAIEEDDFFILKETAKQEDSSRQRHGRGAGHARCAEASGQVTGAGVAAKTKLKAGSKISAKKAALKRPAAATKRSTKR